MRLTLLETKTDVVPQCDAPPKEPHAEASAAIGLDSQHWVTHPLSHRLRAATAELHHRAEKLLDLPTRIFDRSSYTETLKQFYGIYAPLERALAQQSGWDKFGLDPKDRSHVARIARDLTSSEASLIPARLLILSR
jgi:hypothetical protein